MVIFAAKYQMPFGPRVTLILIIITGDMKDLIAWEKIALRGWPDLSSTF